MAHALNDDALEAMERNMKIIRARIMKSLHRTLWKIEILVCLDQLTENEGKAIKHLFSPDDLAEILKVLKKYRKKIDSSIILISKMKKEASYVTLDAKSDPKVTNVMQMLFKNENIQNFAHCAAEKATGGIKEFLDAMKELVDIIEKRIYTSSSDQMNYEKSLGQLWKANNLHKVRITDRQTTFRDLENNLVKKMKNGLESMKECRQTLSTLEENNEREMLQIVNASERTMATNTMMSSEKVEQFKEDAKLMTQQYELLLEEHMREEKALRTKRYKIETILVNWLSKYDQEIGDLHKDFEEIEEGFNGEKEILDELQERFDKQEEEYIILMEEKNMEEQREFDEKFAEITRWHAAKRLQKWWRFIIFKRTKAKKKGGKKKKK